MVATPPKVDQSVTLADKYDLGCARVYVTGAQAIVRLMINQRARDLAAGHSTAGYVSGYRGSPVGNIDLQMQLAARDLENAHVKFEPGVNEDVAATAMWGTQQAGLYGEGRYDGVFGLWYAKGPGVDRSGDALRHANLAGTAPLGGVVALAGDDHTAESSTTAHQSEFAFVDAMIPILNPAGLQDLIDYGIHGYALSRFSGCWAGLKAVKDTIEVTASIDADPHRVKVRLPEDFDMPPGGLNIRAEDPVLAQEARLHDHKRRAALAYARANGLDRIITAGGPHARIGIATLGKSYLDTRQALSDLGIDEARAADLGIRLYKVAMAWPLEPEGLRRFAEGLDLIVVVEEKRGLIETQIREQLYGLANAPVVIGKADEAGRALLPSRGALGPNMIASVLAERIQARTPDERIAARLEDLRKIEAQHGGSGAAAPERLPYFCAGCPHNTSTRLPDGARAIAGIGCHYMAKWMDRATVGGTQMGGEGANWIGEAPFSTRAHIFANIGDGTYNHSGILSIRGAVYAGVTMTYKLLFNDAVALTGGQANDGGLTVEAIAAQLAGEGVSRLVVVTDEPEKYAGGPGFPHGTAIEHRSELDRVQHELESVEGVSVLIYDQTCAAEKRRRRKRGRYPDPQKRVFINELVCEGCGDCGVKSNCVAIEPVETEFGRKRRINQSVCNKDFSCLDGFCPSFVTVEGGALRKAAGTDAAGLGAGAAIALPPAAIRPAGEPCSIVVTGIGGTGVVTIGSLLGMAAHLEGKGCGILDMTGLSQKNGAVTSHVRIANTPADITAVRVAPGGADVILGCDIVTTGGEKILSLMRRGRTHAVVNTRLTMTADFTRNPDMTLNCDLLQRAITARTGEDAARFVDATTLAGALMGDEIASNLFLLGIAGQNGLLPVSPEAIERSIELNGVAAAMNLDAFRWGRRAAVDHRAVEKIAGVDTDLSQQPGSAETLDEVMERRAAYLEAYQDRAYAERYRRFVARAQEAEQRASPGSEVFTDAVARGYFRLLAAKDEYEVARLYTGDEFRAALARTFEGDYRLRFHLAPPMTARAAADGAPPKKRAFGPWMMPLFRLLARLRGLRGTPFDPFGYTAERRRERALIADYEARVAGLFDRLAPQTLETAAEIAALPHAMRGFGHIKAANIDAAKARERELLAELETAAPAPHEAARVA